MAAGGNLPCDSQFLCSICLDVFREPVSTPCGHNYCKDCITHYWDSSRLAQCPMCKKSFDNRPQLQVNTEFRDMVEHFNSVGVEEADEALVKPGEVPCDTCVGAKLKAHKTCLTCMASYCESHLEPHLRVARLKKHELTDPTWSLEDRVCKKHDRMLELFCQTDQVCICFVCFKDDHIAHKAVPLKQAHKEKTTKLQDAVTLVKMTEEAKSSAFREVKDSIQLSQTESDGDISSINTCFSVLEASLKRRKTELIKEIQDKHKAAVTEAEGFAAQLEQELAELRRRRSEMEQLLQTDGDLHLLQNWPSLQLPEHTEEMLSRVAQPLPDANPQIYAGMVKKAVARMEKALNHEMELLFREIRLSDSCEVTQQEDPVENLPFDGFIQDMSKSEDRLLMIQRCYAVNVEINRDTVPPGIVVSEDGKRLSFVEDIWLYSFGLVQDAPPFVALAAKGFSSGRFYYEVLVCGVQEYWLGVTNPDKSNTGHWIHTIQSDGDDFYLVSNASQTKELSLTKRPEKIGVFVDYDDGEVSFYDVDARTLIYSFTRCNFTGASMLKSLLLSVVGGGVKQRQKLYPAFAVFGYNPRSELVITPVAH